MIGESDDRDLVDWRKREVDGTTVYELEYSAPVPEPRNRSRESTTTFGADSGGTVPAREQTIQLPDGERIPFQEAAFEAEGTTLRIRREKPSLLVRFFRYLWW